MADRVRLEPLTGIVVEWDLDVLMRSADAADPSAPPTWELHGEPDWGRLESLRLVGASVGETALAVALARPVGVGAHGEDGVALVLSGPEGADEAHEALVSTEYDPEGRVRRLGLEVWLAGGAGKRIAADRAGNAVTGDADGLRREVTPLVVRLDGESGTGLHELLAGG